MEIGKREEPAAQNSAEFLGFFLISLVTVLLTSGQTIWFGILNFMGCAVLLPWSFLYICGFRFPRIFLRHEAWKQAARCRISGLSAIGSRALWSCPIHQSLSHSACGSAFPSFVNRERETILKCNQIINISGFWLHCLRRVVIITSVERPIPVSGLSHPRGQKRSGAPVWGVLQRLPEWTDGKREI